MPRISVYLPRELENQLFHKAKERRVPFSRLIQEALNECFHTGRKRKAKEAVVKLLAKVSFKPWEEIHQERTVADDGRS